MPNLVHVNNQSMSINNDIVNDSSRSTNNIMTDDGALIGNELSESSKNSSNIMQKSKYVHEIPLESRIFAENNRKWIGNSVCFSFSKLPRFDTDTKLSQDEAGNTSTLIAFARTSKNGAKIHSPARMAPCKV